MKRLAVRKSVAPMQTIYISYGITKSASTFAWQLIKRIALAGGLPVATLSRKSKGTNSPHDYIEIVTNERVRSIRLDVGDAPVVVKTHGPPSPVVARMVAEGGARVFASYRDPRDIALSLLDHAARSRQMGIKDFAEFHKLPDTIASIGSRIRRLEEWVQSCSPILVPYDEICFETPATVHRIADALGVSVDDEAIAAEFANAKEEIGQFNVGIPRRFAREMSEQDSKMFLERFRSFYEKYYPDELYGAPTQRSASPARVPERSVASANGAGELAVAAAVAMPVSGPAMKAPGPATAPAPQKFSRPIHSVTPCCNRSASSDGFIRSTSAAS